MDTLPQFAKGAGLNRRAFQPQYGTAGRRMPLGGRRPTDQESTMTSDTESRLYSDDDEQRSRISTSTHLTSVSQQVSLVFSLSLSSLRSIVPLPSVRQ